MMKKLAVVIVLVLAAGGYFLYQQEIKATPKVKTPDTTATPPTSDATNSQSGATPTSSASAGSATGNKTFKDGTYVGDTTDAVYGPMQVQIAIVGGKLADVKFLQFPNSPGHTTEVSNQALPLLRQEALQKQSAPVDVVSGATQDTDAFNQSLSSALTKAQ